MYGIPRSSPERELMSVSAQIEQRTMRRFLMQLPVQVRLNGRGGEILAVTKDVSARGIYIYLDADVAKSSPIEFILTLPPEITMTQSIRVACSGRVVRVDDGPGGKAGVAAAIDRYQFLDGDA